MWTVIYIAQKLIEVQKLRQKLETNRILVRVHALAAEQPASGEGYVVLVPAAEVSQAHTVMFDADF